MTGNPMAQAIGKDKTTQVTKGKNDRVEDCVDGNMPHVQRSFDGHDVHKSSQDGVSAYSRRHVNFLPRSNEFP